MKGRKTHIAAVTPAFVLSSVFLLGMLAFAVSEIVRGL